MTYPNALLEAEYDSEEKPTSPDGPEIKRHYGLECLIFAAKLHQIDIDIRHMATDIPAGVYKSSDNVILYAARHSAIKAGCRTFTWARMAKAPLPAIARLTSGEYIVIVRTHGSVLSAHDPANPTVPVFWRQQDFEKVWNGNLILLKPKTSSLNTNAKFDISWFKKPIFFHRRILSEILVAAFFVQCFSLVTPLLTQVIIDKVVVHHNIATLQLLGFGMLISIFFEACLTFSQNYLMAHTGTRLDVVLGSRVFAHLMCLPLRYFENRKVGDTVARIREMDSIRQFLTGNSISTILDSLFLVIFLGVLYYYSSALTLLVISSLPVFILLSLLARPALKAGLEKKMDAGSRSQAYLVESMTGILTVKSLAIESIIKNKWGELTAQFANASLKSAQMGSMIGATGQLINRLLTLAILWNGAQLVIESKLTVGELIAFQMLAGRVIQPVVRLSAMWQELTAVLLSVRRLGDIMNSVPEQTQRTSTIGDRTNGSLVEFESIRFRYLPDGPYALDGLTFRAEKGKTLGIVGRSGSGKSTITKILQNLYTPEAGTVKINGIDIKNVDNNALRRTIGVVAQDNFLFSGSIFQNIAIQRPDAKMHEVVAAAQLAGAHDFIVSMKDGYETLVGERGATLSGGQRQRVAIARTLLTDPAILVFDEATSALDSESESIIQNNLKAICQGRTVLIVAHRLTTIENCDRIIVVDNGKIVEDGNHNQLLHLNGLYHHLFSQQSKL